MGKVSIKPIKNSHFISETVLYFSDKGFMTTMKAEKKMELIIKKIFPKKTLGAFVEFSEPYKTSIMAPVKPRPIPRNFLAPIFSLRKR